MEDELKKNLDDELNRELMQLCAQDPSEEGYSAATERVSKLYDLKIKENLAQQEMQLKVEQASTEKRNFWVKAIIDTAAIVLPIGFYGLWMKRGLKFEQTGAFTSQTFRGLINCFKPKR